MEKKKKGVMQSIPGWAWVLISLAAAILLWYALSKNSTKLPVYSGYS